MEGKFTNKKVIDVRTKCYGHIHKICIELIFDNCKITINPNRKWFSFKGKDKFNNDINTMPFFQLFCVFEIDCEDGASFEEIKGKYCRLYSEGFEIKSIYNIIDDICVPVEDLQ